MKFKKETFYLAKRPGTCGDSYIAAQPVYYQAIQWTGDQQKAYRFGSVDHLICSIGGHAENMEAVEVTVEMCETFGRSQSMKERFNQLVENGTLK